MPQPSRRRVLRSDRAAATSQAAWLLDLAAAAQETAGRRVRTTVDELRARAQEAAEQAAERAAAAAGLAVKLAYASVGAAVVAQELVAGRVRELAR